MHPIRQLQPPASSLIAPFMAREGVYADAFCVEVPTEQYLRDFVSAFYTTGLFRAERAVLGLLARTPTSDADAMALAAGVTDRFAVWTVAARTEDQILLADASGRTKSWLHARPGAHGTQLWFGSVVLPGAQGRMELGFRLLLGPHRLYARMLLRAAARNLGG
jgi:hypothetical protein